MYLSSSISIDCNVLFRLSTIQQHAEEIKGSRINVLL